MAKLRITQTKSRHGVTKRQIANLQALGLHRVHQTIEVESNPVSKGMVEKVLHLVEVEEIN